MKRIIILGIVVVIVVAAWSGAWLWGASQIKAYEATLEAADGETTPKFTCATFNVGGYPFGFDLSCDGAIVTLGDQSVTAAGLRASAEVYNPFHVLVFAKSPVTIEDAFTGSKSRLDFASLEASARLTGWRIGRVSLIVEKPLWNDTVLDDRLLAQADHAEAHLIDLPDLHDAKAGLAGLGQYVEIDNLNAPGFEINAGKATLESDVTNLPDDVRTYGDPDLIKRWQAAGGKFTLKGLKGDDGPDTHFEATGEMALDASGRVGGSLKLSSKGVVERVGPLFPDAWRGLIVGPQAEDGTYSQNLNIVAGTVFSGLVPVAAIPPAF